MVADLFAVVLNVSFLVTRSVLPMTVWSEYVPDLQIVKVYRRGGESATLEVFVNRHKLMVATELGEFIALHLPLDCPPEAISIGDVVECANIFSVTVRVPWSISTDFLHSVSGTLTEDWSTSIPLTCKNCSGPLNDVVPIQSLTPCLLPSAAWGFEDMRVCEECGPLACHGNLKRSKRDNFYISDTDLFIDAGNEECSCPQCGTALVEPLSEGELQFIRQRITDSSLEDIRRIKKQRFGGLFCGYTLESIYLNNLLENDLLKVKLVHPVTAESLFLHFITGARELIVKTFEDEYRWGTRVMFSKSISRRPEAFTETVLHDGATFEAIKAQLETYSLPLEMSLSKQWRISVALIPPTLVEL